MVIFVAHMDWEIETKEIKCIWTFVTELDSLYIVPDLDWKSVVSNKSK
jgi:hypothetical protein